MENITAAMAATPFARKLMSSDIAHMRKWRKELIKNTFSIDKLDDERRINPPSQLLQFHSYVNELKDLIETDPQVNMLFTSMFTEEPQDPDPESRIRDYTEMLILMNYITTTAPSFVGLYAPIEDILQYAMATPSGTIAFLNKDVNRCFKKVLSNWARFLDHPNSRYVLDRDDPDSWLSDKALAKMENFEETYKIDKEDEKYWGFASWNDFFSRRLKPGARPVPEDTDVYTVVAACDATPYRICTGNDVKFRSTFWIKSQPYSLQHMLNNEPIAESFVGGTVYQYYLTVTHYHRWHVPVDGTIQKAYVAEGTYYAEAPSVGYSTTADTESRSYLTNLSNRAIILIKADAPDIGVVALVMIGLEEINGNKIDVYEGQKVKKGDPMGTFEYGGSSYVMCFQKDVMVKFEIDPIPSKPELVKVNSKVAQVQPRMQQHG